MFGFMKIETKMNKTTISTYSVMPLTQFPDSQFRWDTLYAKLMSQYVPEKSKLINVDLQRKTDGCLELLRLIDHLQEIICNLLKIEMQQPYSQLFKEYADMEQ